MLRETQRVEFSLPTVAVGRTDLGQNLGGSNQTLRAENKSGVVDQPFQVNAPESEETGNSVHLSQDVRKTRRQTIPVNTWYSGIDAGQLGDLLWSGLHTTTSIRGRSEMPYVPDNTRIMADIGGNHNRVIGQFRQGRRIDNLINIPNPTYETTGIKMIPEVRLTKRAIQDAVELALEPDDC
jgi:hypothetical protein